MVRVNLKERKPDAISALESLYSGIPETECLAVSSEIGWPAKHIEPDSLAYCFADAIKNPVGKPLANRVHNRNGDGQFNTSHFSSAT